MKRIKIILVITSYFAFYIGCSTRENLGNGFSVFYVDNPDYRNIYYDNQGILLNDKVCSVMYNDSLIIVGLNNSGDDNYPTKFILIDKKLYSQDKLQEESKGFFSYFSEQQIGELTKKCRKLDVIEY